MAVHGLKGLAHQKDPIAECYQKREKQQPTNYLAYDFPIAHIAKQFLSHLRIPRHKFIQTLGLVHTTGIHLISV